MGVRFPPRLPYKIGDKNVDYLKLFRPFSGNPLLIGFLVKKKIEFEFDDIGLLGFSFGPLIFITDRINDFEKKYRDFIIQHEVGHVRQFYYTLGMIHLVYILSGFFPENRFISKICKRFEESADKYAEKKTGVLSKDMDKIFCSYDIKKIAGVADTG